MSKLKINVEKCSEKTIEAGDIFHNDYHTVMIVESCIKNYYIVDLSNGDVLVDADGNWRVIKDEIRDKKYKKVDAELIFKYYKD